MAESAVLGAPVKVSPFIRFSRWSLLLAGIAYGFTRNSYLTKKENEHRAYVAKMTPVWTAQRKAALEAKNKAEMLALKQETGVEL